MSSAAITGKEQPGLSVWLPNWLSRVLIVHVIGHEEALIFMELPKLSFDSKVLRGPLVFTGTCL